ncbi:hypothetical protein ABW19_dt0206517 [Dactylella cylindrospora]|nr:hypothetical protein ABW19_dt0206517 [Dactylella cylindrospora]
MLACSFEFRGNFIGIVSALAGTIIFVTQNIVSKKIFNNSARSDYEKSQGVKLDKLNLLAYSSGLAFILTTPLWLYSEGFTLIRKHYADEPILKGGENALSGWDLIMEFIFNGTSHFGQNIIAFAILSMVEPVTYSVASLIKRIFVIVMAIVWFGNMPTNIQAVGIGLTFLGLYLYDKAKDLDRKDKAKPNPQPNLLPLFTDPKTRTSPAPLPYASSNTTTSVVNSPMNGGYHARRGSISGANSAVAEKKAATANGYPGLGSVSETNGSNDYSHPPALLPGTRQESTWKPNEVWANGVTVKTNGIAA